MSNAFYCAVCDVQSADSLAAEAHKASLRHKRRTGELAAGLRQYKKDEEVTVDDIMALVERRRIELEVTPWSELRYKPKA